MEDKEVFKRCGYTVLERNLSNLKGKDKISKILVYSIIKSWKRTNTIYKEVADTIISDVTYKQIEMQLNMNVDRIIPELIKSGIFNGVFKKTKGKEERNIYTFKPEDNYFYLDNGFFENTTKDNNKIKGFLLLLKCFCLYNTNIYKSKRPRNGKLNNKELAELLELDIKTLNKYLEAAIELNWLQKIEGGLLITNPFIKADRIKEDDALTYLYEVIYNWCISHNCLPPKREDKPLRALYGAYPNNDEDYKFYTDNNIKCTGYLPLVLEERLSKMPEQVNWQYLISALLNNKDMMKNTTIKIAVTL